MPAFLSNVCFSYESHIQLNGFVNRKTAIQDNRSRQITRFLGFERADIIVEKPFHSHNNMVCDICKQCIPPSFC